MQKNINNTLSKTLVTTSIKSTIPKNKSIVFLGDWCLLRGEYDDYRFDYIVHEYHWNNKKKMKSDSVYLEKFYKNVIPIISNILNHKNNVNYSNRYWEITLGRWLLMFIYALYDRWMSVTTLFNQHKINEIYILNNVTELHSLNDSISNMSTDIWNEGVFSNIVQLYFSDKLKIKKINASCKVENPKKADKTINILNKIRSFALNTIGKLSIFFISNNDFLFFKSHLPLSVQFKLQLKLGQIPHYISNFDKETNERKCIKSSRNWGSWLKGDDPFMQVFNDMLPKYLPIEFLESFGESINNKHLKRLSSKKNTIVTGATFSRNFLESHWVASQVEKGAKLLVLQHGGGYGITEERGYENYEVNISDNFLSWGWSDKDRLKIIPLGILRMHSNRTRLYKKYNKAILVEFTDSVYLNTLHGAINTSWELYFENQLAFYGALSEKSKRGMEVKLQPGTFNKRRVRDRWIDKFENINFSDNSLSVIDYINKGFLCVCTYNSTSYLESMSLNSPTIIFFSNEGVRKDAIPYFDLLKSVGIFFESPQDAAKHLNKIWDDVGSWWFSEKVQGARSEFCSKYCNLPDNIIHKSVSILKDTI